jgi:hypothetical protein
MVRPCRQIVTRLADYWSDPKFDRRADLPDEAQRNPGAAGPRGETAAHYAIGASKSTRSRLIARKETRERA